MINVAIKEGWAGGPWFSNQFAAAVKAAEYNITAPAHADVLFAHSIACYDLPLKSPVTTYILIDPPYWPGKPFLKSMMEDRQINKTIGQQPRDWKYAARELYWKLAYIAAKPRYSAQALKAHNSVNFLGSLNDKHVILIRNQLDPYCSPDIQIALAAYPNVQYFVLPGAHSDYYTNPQPYIALLPKQI